jgi:hypothetical protein
MFEVGPHVPVPARPIDAQRDLRVHLRLREIHKLRAFGSKHFRGRVVHRETPGH